MSIILQTHGNVTGVAVHKGYCFVQYERPENAAKAIEKEAGSMFLGKRIDVKPAKRGAGPPKEKEPEPPQQRHEEEPHHKPQPSFLSPPPFENPN